MALSKIQSIVARLSIAEDARTKAANSWSIVREPNKGAELDGALRKLRHELFLAGLKDLVGHDGVEIQALAVDQDKPRPLIIRLIPTTLSKESAPPSFGPKVAQLLNGCRPAFWGGWEDQFHEEAKASDHQCIRSERTIRNLLTQVALDHCNGAPEEVLDPITPAEMTAFDFPGGLLSAQSSARAEPTPRA